MRRLLLLAVAVIAYLGVIRPRLLRWGADTTEAVEPLPGDDLVAHVDTQSTMATTIAAAPEQVWPWLVQMGCDRAGWYSWDWLDNARRPSADRIHPEWQAVAVGDRLASTPSGSAYFTVAVLDPSQALVLRADLGLTGRPFDPAGEVPKHASTSTWALVLRPTDEGATRLVVRTRSAGSPAWLRRITNTFVWEPAHAIMQRRQFANLRRRASMPRATAGPSTGRPTTPG